MPDTFISPVRYPTLYRYLSGLPHGMDSYPTVLSAAAVADAPRQKFGDALKRDDLPEPIKKMLDTPWKKGTWIPEVHFMCVMALVRDVVHKSDEKYQQYIFEGMKEQYSGPLMRSVMFVLSPYVLCLTVEKRWGAFKRGVPMKSVQSDKDSCSMVITYPPRLYVVAMLEGMAKSFEAALSCTRVKAYSVKAKIISDEECHFVATWTI